MKDMGEINYMNRSSSILSYVKSLTYQKFLKRFSMEIFSSEKESTNKSEKLIKLQGSDSDTEAFNEGKNHKVQYLDL